VYLPSILHSRALVSLGFQDFVVQSRQVVRVVNFTHRHKVDHLGVLLSLGSLELVNGEHTMQIANKSNENRKLFDVSISLFNCCLMLEDVSFFTSFGLPETFYGCFALYKFVKLGLLFKLSAFAFS
jgi:hypothetical protein